MPITLSYSILNISNSSVFGDHDQILGDNNSLTLAYSFVWGNSNTVTGDVNSVLGNSNTVIGDDNQVTGSNNKVTGGGNTVIGDFNTEHGDTSTISGNYDIVQGNHDRLTGDHGLVIGGFATVNGNYNHVYGVEAVVTGNFNQVYGWNASVSGNGNTVTGDELIVKGDGNTIVAQKTSQSVYSSEITGNNNMIIDADNELLHVHGNSNTFRITHSDTLTLFGLSDQKVGTENNDTFDFTKAITGKTDIWGFNATDHILVGFNETATVTKDLGGLTDLHISGGGASYDVIFHDTGATVAVVQSHITHAAEFSLV